MSILGVFTITLAVKKTLSLWSSKRCIQTVKIRGLRMYILKKKSWDSTQSWSNESGFIRFIESEQLNHLDRITWGVYAESTIQETAFTRRNRECKKRNKRYPGFGKLEKLRRVMAGNYSKFCSFHYCVHAIERMEYEKT